MLSSKIEKANWAEKRPQRFVALEKQPQCEIACFGCFLNNHNALWHEINSHNSKCLLNELFMSLVTYW